MDGQNKMDETCAGGSDWQAASKKVSFEMLYFFNNKTGFFRSTLQLRIFSFFFLFLLLDSLVMQAVVTALSYVCVCVRVCAHVGVLDTADACVFAFFS